MSHSVSYFEFPGRNVILNSFIQSFVSPQLPTMTPMKGKDPEPIELNMITSCPLKLTVMSRPGPSYFSDIYIYIFINMG